MTRANAGCRAAPSGSSMISRSENRLTRNGSTDARSSGPPRLKSRTAVEVLAAMCQFSNRAGKDRAVLVSRQITIERHADVADKEPSALRDAQGLGRNIEQPVADRAAGFAQLFELRLEALRQVDAEPLAQLRGLEPEVAHQLGDYEAADLVVLAQRVAALHRQPAGVDRLVVVRQRLVVLR